MMSTLVGYVLEMSQPNPIHGGTELGGKAHDDMAAPSQGEKLLYGGLLSRPHSTHLT